MQPLKFLFSLLLLLCIGLTGIAEQPAYTTINGYFSEKATAEIVIVKKENGKPLVLVQCFKDQDQPYFSLRFPVVTGAEYVMKVNIMKQGSRRMELDNTLSVPIQPQAGAILAYTVKPSIFDQEKGTGALLTKGIKNFSSLTITGALKNASITVPITLSKVVDGQLQPVQTITTIKDDPDFCFHVPVATEGFYYIGNLGWNKRIYIKPGDSLHVNITANGHEMQWLHTTRENELLTQWQLLIEPITYWGYERSVVNVKKFNLDSFTNNYKQLQPAIKNFKALITGPNRTFNNLLRTAMAIDNQYAALRLLFYLSVKQENGFIPSPKEFANVPVYFTEALLREPVTNMRIMQVGEGREYFNLLTKFSLVAIDINKRAHLSIADRLQVMLKFITNDTLRSVFLAEQLNKTEVNNLREFKEVFGPLQKYATTPAAKKIYQQMYSQFIGDTAFIGKSAWNFSLPDTAGNMISMKDFRGRVVLIDVWATWCGPCKAQFPFLLEIEEEFKDNPDIVFVGISTDKIEKKEAWLNLIKEKKLGGVQLLDDFGKSFARKYGITAIPRFMLIDKQGRWIEIRCPLPENKESLKKYLNEALAAGKG